MAELATQVAVAAAEPGIRGEDDARWKAALGLPCNLTVEIPVPGVTVKDLIELRMESVIGSECLTTGNLPLKVNGERIAWCEFEVLGNRLAARLTELA